MKQTLVVHGGSPFARDLARLAGMVLGPSRVVDDLDGAVAPDGAAGFIVIVDDHGAHLPFATGFVAAQLGWLRLTRVALITTEPPIDHAVSALARLLGVPDVLRVVVPPPEAHKLHRVSRDSMEETAGQLLALARAKRRLAASLPREELVRAIEAILSAHTTGVLAVASHGRVRSLPIVYSYEQGHVYSLTEGGEELAHVLAHPTVALSVVDSLRLSGRARVHAPGEGEHARVTARHGLAPASSRFVLDVTLHEAELIDPRFEERGLPARQTLVF